MFCPEITAIHDPGLAARLDAAIDGKTKPLGSLGRLETLARQMGLVQATLRPAVLRPSIVVFAGDHGVAEEGVSAYPQDVTWQMVENFLAGGAAINVFARRGGIGLHIVDAGVKHDFAARPGLILRKIRAGTRNFTREAAMTKQECELALRRGMELVDAVPGNVLGFGEMGIANTTAAAALLHRLGGVPLEDCVGAGTGLDAGGIRRKQAVLRRALALHAEAGGPFEALAAFGGYEIAMMAGAMLGAAAQRRLLLIDGFIVGSALMVAAALRPAILDYCVFGHRSNERGHERMLDVLGARPLLDLDMRLGEGTGCALALPLVHAAADFLCDMATFDSAGVCERTEENTDGQRIA